MSSVINTNLASLNTQRNLSSSQASLATSIQRLSSGMRVNSAKDDAAGLAIAERMNAASRGMTMAARNANDGVSLAQTAEGGLSKIADMVQRMRELAIQSSNATNSASDRAALQAEVKQLRDQVQTVASTTNFNGTKLLDGSYTAQTFQVGADFAQGIEVAGIANAQTTSMGQLYTKDQTTFANAGAVTSVAAGDFTINGVDLGAVKGTGAAGVVTADDMARAINNIGGQTGVYATVATDATTGDKTLTLISANETNTIELSGTAATDLGLDADDGTTAGTLDKAMDELDVSTAAGAQKALIQADAALKTINSARADLGALQSRFENAVANLQVANENVTAARSRIMDTDFAAESANLARAQILQQAGNAMLSQANQLPQQVMSLLRS